MQLNYNMKPEYIQNLESKENIFSVMVCHTLKGEFLKYLNEKKLTRVYEKSSMNESGFLNFQEVIFKSQQNFYLFVEIKTIPQSDTISNLTIYYKVEQYNELFLFLSQLLKQYKNATTNNRTT
jgi:hypothetical protein